MGREQSRSRPAPFQQRTNTSWRSTRCQPTVSRWFFRCFGAHLLRSPSIVKSGLVHLARFLTTRGQTPPAENLGSPAPFYVLCQVTSFRCRLCFVSQCYAFHHRVSFQLPFRVGNEKPCFHSGKQGLEIRCVVRLPAHLQSIQTGSGRLPAIRLGQAEAIHITPAGPTMTCRFRDRRRRPNRD
jgi:hypothetical protein